MAQDAIDLERERLASLARPRLDYSQVTRAAVRGMDVLAGPETTVLKARIVESLAPIPYRAWESREYRRLTTHHDDDALVRRAAAIVAWGREAQDKEFLHLRVVAAKLAQDGEHAPLRFTRPVPDLMTGSWSMLSRGLSWVSVRRAMILNAEAEDHAEHYYAELVGLHPEWEEQPAGGEAVREYAEAVGEGDGFRSWADVFRRIGLDERDHMNASLAFAGRPEQIARYEGMPDTPGLEEPAA